MVAVHLIFLLVVRGYVLDHARDRLELICKVRCNNRACGHLDHVFVARDVTMFTCETYASSRDSRWAITNGIAW